MPSAWIVLWVMVLSYISLSESLHVAESIWCKTWLGFQAFAWIYFYFFESLVMGASPEVISVLVYGLRTGYYKVLFCCIVSPSKDAQWSHWRGSLEWFATKKLYILLSYRVRGESGSVLTLLPTSQVLNSNNTLPGIYISLPCECSGKIA